MSEDGRKALAELRDVLKKHNMDIVSIDDGNDGYCFAIQPGSHRYKIDCCWLTSGDIDLLLNTPPTKQEIK